MNELKGTESYCEGVGEKSFGLYSIHMEDLGRVLWLAFNSSEGIVPWNGP